MEPYDRDVNKNKKVTSFTIIGILLGIPLSYFFQSQTIRGKMSLTQYLGNLPELINRAGGEVVIPLVISCIVFAIIGGVVGYFMEQNQNKGTPN